MLEGPLLGLMYVLAVFGGIMGLYVVFYALCFIYELCVIMRLWILLRLQKHKTQEIQQILETQEVQNDTINDYLIVGINNT